MFGFVMANTRELDKTRLTRYNTVYCGVCRQIRGRTGSLARFGLSYDCAFLSLLLMSLYEPEETGGRRACGFHPLCPRPWTDNEYIRYGADMNMALAYYNALDDYEDEGSLAAKKLAEVFGRSLENIRQEYPRQCSAIEQHLHRLNQLEKENCRNPDEPASCFGSLLAELLVYREDLWAPRLRQMGMGLGRFIYLADAAVDFGKDKRKKQYNPFLAMGMEEADWALWDQYLVLAMGLCTEAYEQLPLVQDKAILDNILYSGVWLQCRRRQKGGKRPVEDHDD